MSRRRATHALAAAVVVAVVAGTTGCGVSTGEDTYSAIPTDEIPFGLDATSTSTTSTTTTTTTTTTIPDQSLPPTTTTPIRLEPLTVYFLSRGRLQPVETVLQTGFSPDQVADLLEEGPPPNVALDTLVEDGLIMSAGESAGVLTVDLDPDTFDRIPSTQQTEAIAHIVLMMIDSLNRVGQVTFTLGGEPIAVKKGNGLLSDVGEILSFEDYAVLLIPRATTGTTVVTTTTVPPDAGLTPTSVAGP